MDNTSVGGPVPPTKGPTYAWWLVLCLVGLDYFSTLAYLPSIAVAEDRQNAPLAALGIVVLTLLCALPVYLYVVGRSPHGQGATGLLERLVYGWSGKVFILVLLGFVGTDFVVTRTLSVADASRHIIHNPYWQAHVEWITHHKDTVRSWFPSFLQGGFFDFWNEQLVLTVILSILAFGFYAFVIRGFNRPFMVFAALVVGVYLVLNAIVIGAGVAYLANHPDRLESWLNRATDPSVPMGSPTHIAGLALLAVVSIPGIALGLSGFELSMTSAPLVRGRPDDDPGNPRGRIRRTRLLLVVATLLMSIFIVGSVTSVAHLVPTEALLGSASGDKEANGPAMHRALAYLAHGGKVDMAEYVPRTEEKIPEVSATEVCPLFGPAFGTLYDLSTVLILCLAGASVTIGLRAVVPQYLAKFGMQLHWAEKVGVILHLFNVIILVVAIGFRASISHQQWAYTASVLVLMTSAGLAALLDQRRRLQEAPARGRVLRPLLLSGVVLLGLGLFARGIWRLIDWYGSTDSKPPHSDFAELMSSLWDQEWFTVLSLVFLLALLGTILVAVLRGQRRQVENSLFLAPFFLICLVFLGLIGLTLVQSRAGLYIPLLFILVVLGTAFASRWLRSTELRFKGFAFADEESRKRWDEICQLEFQVLVPHRPDHLPLSVKDQEIRRRHRLGPEVPVIFIEAELGDTSEFLQQPLMKILKREGLEVIQVSRCASISHVIAAIGLEFRHVGRPPEIHFGWSDESPMAANLGFLLFGEGNIPWMVHALIRKAEPQLARRPRVVIG